MAGGSCAPVSGPTAASARWRAAGWCKAARNRASCLAARSGSIEPTTSNRDVPGTRLVISSSGSVLLATTSGRNGTLGSRASAVRTPISCARRSAAGRDQANFTMNRSPTGALPDCHSGSCLAAGPGTVTGYPLSSGATTRSASRSAAAEHSASHFICDIPSRHAPAGFGRGGGAGRSWARRRRRVGLRGAGWTAVRFQRELAVVRVGHCGPDPLHDLAGFGLADLDVLVLQVAALGGD